MPTKIFIGNLSASTRSEDLRQLFEKYGKVTESDVLKNFGFVHMQSEDEANEAIKNLDGYNIKGSRMRVELSTGKSRGGGGMRGGGRGGGGGRMRGGGGGRGGGRPGDRGGDRYGRSSYDPYPRPPPSSYDYYDRGYPPRREERRPPPPGEDRYYDDHRYPPPPRDRYAGYSGYERRPPPPEYDRGYDRPRTAASDPYYRERSSLAGRPPPDYYNSRRYPDPAGDARPPYPSVSPYDDYMNGYRGKEPEPGPPGETSNYYDRFYKKPAAMPSSSGGRPSQTMQAEPLYF